MKKIIPVFICSTLMLLSPQLMAEDSVKQTVVKKSNIVTKTIGVKGMTCVGCEVTLEKSIKKVHGVVAVQASASDKNAIIQYDKTKTDENTVTKMIEKMGYKPFNVVEQ